MARGKFNKRGGGPRVDAQSAEEIELRNRRLAELDQQRAERRAESDDEDATVPDGKEDGEEGKKDDKNGEDKEEYMDGEEPEGGGDAIGSAPANGVFDMIEYI
jgi:hypothetical protein